MLQTQRGFGKDKGADQSRGVPRAQGVEDPPGLLPALGTSSHRAGMQSSARGWWQGQIRPWPLAAWPQNTRNARPRP